MAKRKEIMSGVFVGALLAASAASALPREGGGASNGGGKAVVCPGRPPKMLDVYLVVTSPLPEDRETFAKSVEDKLDAETPAFARAWREEWDRIGASEDWPVAKDETLETEDAFQDFPLGVGCRLAQTAYFIPGEWIPRRIDRNYAALPVVQRRILELHESLYILGARDYGHLSPTLTRDLVAMVLGDQVSDTSVLQAIARFLILYRAIDQDPNGKLLARGVLDPMCTERLYPIYGDFSKPLVNGNGSEADDYRKAGEVYLITHAAPSGRRTFTLPPYYLVRPDVGGDAVGTLRFVRLCPNQKPFGLPEIH